MESQIVFLADYEQQLNSESLMQELQNDEALSNVECNLECPRWSSLESDIPASEELSGCDLPASNAVFNTTFPVEVDSVGGCTSPTGSLDPKTAQKITYDLDEPAGIQKCNADCNDNDTFILHRSKNDCTSIPGVNCFVGNSVEVLPPLSLHNEALSSDCEAEYLDRRSYDVKHADIKGKVANCKSYMSDFDMADDELDGSSFKSDDNGYCGASAVCVTSTPLASDVAHSANNQLDTELTVKLVRRMSSPAEHEFPQCVPRARRMLQMRDINNATKEGVGRNCTKETFQNPDINMLDISFTVSPVERDNDQVFLDVGSPKHDQTFILSKLDNSATGGFAGNLSCMEHLTPVRYRGGKTRKNRLLSSVKYGSSCVQQQSAHQLNSLCMSYDISLSNNDVFQDGDIASFFVTEFPSVLTGECHDFLRSAFHRWSISSAQTQDVSSSCPIGIVVNSADSSPDDWITDWSFSSLMEQAYPSFDVGSVNELDDDALRQHSSMRRLSSVAWLTGLDEETQQLKFASKYNLTFVLMSSLKTN